MYVSYLHVCCEHSFKRLLQFMGVLPHTYKLMDFLPHPYKIMGFFPHTHAVSQTPSYLAEFVDVLFVSGKRVLSCFIFLTQLVGVNSVIYMYVCMYVCM